MHLLLAQSVLTSSTFLYLHFGAYLGISAASFLKPTWLGNQSR